MLEDYFDFLTPGDIRLKGSRIGIESVLYEYIHRAQTPEAIGQMFPSLTLEQVYATILLLPEKQASKGDSAASRKAPAHSVVKEQAYPEKKR